MRARLSITLLAASTTALAQTHKVAAPQRVTRAVAVYEFTGTLDHPTAARLVPVTLFIDGQLEDAGVYLSRPIPFALQAGLQYEVDVAGEPAGTFNVDSSSANLALNHPAANSTDEGQTWYGVGRFSPPPTAAELAARQKKLKVSAKPGVIVGGTSTGGEDDRPSFIRRAQPAGPPDPATTASNTTPGASPGSGEGKGGNGGIGTSSGSGNPDDPNDRPTLRHRDDTATADSKKKPKRERPAGYVTGPADSLNDDPDRPTLHRGTPAEDVNTPVLLGLPADLHQVAAVSDNVNREPHPFAFSFESQSDRGSTLAALEALARPRLATYIAANHLRPVAASFEQPAAPVALAAPAVASSALAPGAPASQATAADPSAPDEADHKLITRSTSSPSSSPSSIPSAAAAAAATTPVAPAAATTPVASPAPKASAKASAKATASGRPAARGSRRAAAPAAAPIVLTHEQLQAWQLVYGGLPTFVYSVQVPVATGGPVYLTLIAQRLATGELQPALTSVTDASHLDRSPWLRPVDVVDPDAAHRGNLLMELRGKSTREFALYRVITAQAEQTFATGPLE